MELSVTPTYKTDTHYFEQKMKKWTHSELGEFVFNGFAWDQQRLLKAFSIFPYVEYPKTSKWDHKTPLVDISFESFEDENVPTQQQVKTALTVLSNHEKLIEEGLMALFDDIKGTGPGSGMWWRFEMDVIKDRFEYKHPNFVPYVFDQPEHLHMMLGSPSISVCESNLGSENSYANLCFEACFEPEHGVGLLTDGQSIIGLGYSGEARPFK